MVNNGHEIIIEAGAGNSANFPDSDYSEAGAKIAYSAEEVYKADIILKVAPPSPKEMELLQNRQTLISILHITNQIDGFIKTT